MRSISWGIPFFLGLALAVLGVFAASMATLSSVASILFIGSLLMVSGVLEVISAFRVRGAGRFALPFMGGIFSFFLGLLFLKNPAAGLGAITLCLALYFLGTGVFRAFLSLVDRYPGWGWDCFGGVVSAICGGIVLASWPISSMVLLGTLVGVEMLMRGSTVMSLSLGLRKLQRGLSVR